MNLDRMMYLVISELKCGPLILEVELHRMDRSTVLREAREGQYDEILAVIELNPVEKTCREVTSDDDFQDAIQHHADAVTERGH
jgi:hypothetical protein